MENEKDAIEQEHLISVRVEGNKTFYRIGTSSDEHEIVFDDVITEWIRESFYLLEHIAEEREKRNVIIYKQEDKQENTDSSIDAVDVIPKDRFFGLSETVVEQFLYYLIINELSYSDNNHNLNFLSYHIVCSGVKLSNHLKKRREQEQTIIILYNNTLALLGRLIMDDFNVFHQAFYFDFYIGFWSGFESCINGICVEYETIIQRRCNISQIKNLKRLMNLMYADKEYCEIMLNDFNDDIAIKKFPKYVSFNDRINFIFDEIIKDRYSRDKKHDRDILEFCAALRNTMHNNGTHLKVDKRITINGKEFDLPQNGKMFTEKYADIFLILRELFDIYVAIYDGLIEADSE